MLERKMHPRESTTSCAYMRYSHSTLERSERRVRDQKEDSSDLKQVGNTGIITAFYP